MKARSVAAALLEMDDVDVQPYLDELKSTVKYLVFPAGNRPYGGGGWSRKARHRPLPEVVTVRTDDISYTGKSVIICGVRRLKCNIWDAFGTPVRIDYPELKL
jgi:hypothetical protein